MEERRIDSGFFLSGGPLERVVAILEEVCGNVVCSMNTNRVLAN
jgi:hypothetical protein